MPEIYIVDGVRTPIGKTGGILKNFLPEQLCATVLQKLVERNKLRPQQIDHVILGNAVGPGGNIARVSILEAGWPFLIPATTIDTQCGSGLASVNFAHALLSSGQAEFVVAGGLESTSMKPKRRFNNNDPRFQKEDIYYEQAPFSPEWVGNPDIGDAAEFLAEKFSITREQMDEQAYSSHEKACQAINNGYLEGIIRPVIYDGNVIVNDECPKEKMSLKLLSRMKGAFKEGGRITAGNSCLKHDGAAVLLLASANALKKYNLQAKAKIYPGVSVGCDPNLFPLGPVYAIKKLLQLTKLKMPDIEALEINEAFAVKILACCKQLGISPSFVNKLGGAIAYGHPYGASGAIILLHLIKTLQLSGGKYGIASIGAVGGIGTATLLERL